jgi:hypothetical protein
MFLQLKRPAYHCGIPCGEQEVYRCKACTRTASIQPPGAYIVCALLFLPAIVFLGFAMQDWEELRPGFFFIVLFIAVPLGVTFITFGRRAAFQVATGCHVQLRRRRTAHGFEYSWPSTFGVGPGLSQWRDQYELLLLYCTGDENTVERLINFEVSRKPGTSRTDAIALSIERWKRDNQIQ